MLKFPNKLPHAEMDFEVTTCLSLITQWLVSSFVGSLKVAQKHDKHFKLYLFKEKKLEMCLFTFLLKV